MPIDVTRIHTNNGFTNIHKSNTNNVTGKPAPHVTG
ncbi:hypothetical protein EYZ11_013555 [Aspergillus tanneri]|uniref:Uncharacterized protein n=1 Tax=Aspergillus tanneri TaxID=1220188 RepID=A0A4S3IXD8_9EURO|nr:hypothetical protein EYZ11_013555 [Aspergillus tanneri]